MFLIHDAMAQAADVAAPAAAPAGNAFMQFVPLILIFVIFYALLIRPQQKRAKEMQTKLDALKKGDKVVTAGGIFGTIVKVDAAEATVEIADGVKIRVQKGSIGDVLADGQQ